jgi:hypothetical protein
MHARYGSGSLFLVLREMIQMPAKFHGWRVDGALLLNRLALGGYFILVGWAKLKGELVPCHA